MNVRVRRAALAGAAALVMSVATSMAQSNPRQQATPTAPQQQTNPLAAQKKAISDAQANINALHAQIAQIRLRIQATFESKDDWVAAKKAVADAQAKYDAAYKPVMDALHANADYQQLATNRKAAQAKLDALKSEPRATDSADAKSQDDELSQAAGEVVSDGFAMNKMEREARENDPTLSAAKEGLSDAKAAMDALQSQVTAAMQADPQYLTVQPQLTSAEQQLAAARAALVAGEKSQRPATPGQPVRRPGS